MIVARIGARRPLFAARLPAESYNSIKTTCARASELRARSRSQNNINNTNKRAASGRGGKLARPSRAASRRCACSPATFGRRSREREREQLMRRRLLEVSGQRLLRNGAGRNHRRAPRHYWPTAGRLTDERTDRRGLSSVWRRAKQIGAQAGAEAGADGRRTGAAKQLLMGPNASRRRRSRKTMIYGRLRLL